MINCIRYEVHETISYDSMKYASHFVLTQQSYGWTYVTQNAFIESMMISSPDNSCSLIILLHHTIVYYLALVSSSCVGRPESACPNRKIGRDDISAPRIL